MADKDADKDNGWLDPEIVAADYPQLPGLPEGDDKTYLWPDGSPVSERSLPRHAPVKHEGQTVYVVGPEPSRLGAAILGIFLGAWPLAIVAIVHANRVNDAWARGKFEESARMARLAGNWVIATYVPTMLLGVVLLFSAVLSGVASA